VAAAERGRVSGDLDHTADAGGQHPASDLAAGAQLGKYKLERVLGSGGMGVVWHAHDPDLDRAVAIKVLRGVEAGPTMRARLLREARAMARLKHPNVLTVYEVGTDGDRDYIVMELVEGTNLETWLRARPSREDAVAAILAAGRGLAAAHSAGLIHRDFKPHNVLRSHDGRVLVTDFGLARGTAGGEAAPEAPAVTVAGTVALADTVDISPTAGASTRSTGLLESTLTQTGALIGTPAYMAPEQFTGAASDPRTDQFAFCVTAWQALAGERPFRGQTFEELRAAVSGGVFSDSAKLPRGIRTVLARGLAPEPGARWSGLDALLDALARATRPRWRRRFALGLAVLGMIGAVALGVTLLRDRDHAPPPPAPAALPCTSADVAFDEVWSPKRQLAFVQRAGEHSGPGLEVMDELRAKWTALYAKTCAAPPTPTAFARIACLLGERDQAAAIAPFFETVPAFTIQYLDRGVLRRMLPRVEACEGDSPVAPPLPPQDPQVREQIGALRAEVRMLALMTPEKLDDARAQQLLDRAHRLWPPIETEVHQAIASAAMRRGELAKAQDEFAKAAEVAADVHDSRNEVSARVALLELETFEPIDARQPGREALLEAQAAAALRRAGGDPMVAASLDRLAATLAFQRDDLAHAIDGFEAARRRLSELKSYLMASTVAEEIHAVVRRDAAGDLDLAWRIGLETERASSDPVPRELSDELVDLAWRRDNLDEAHVRADRGHTVKSFGEPVRGRVVDRDGKPVAGARVVAWRGELWGDATRAFTRRDFSGDVGATGEDGTFELRAPAGAAVVAELATLRSVPVVVGDRPATLVLAPTHVVRGTLRTEQDAGGGFAVGVRVTAGENTWLLAVAPSREPGAARAFELVGVPAAPVTGFAQRAKHRLVQPIHDALELRWPQGGVLEAIVRADDETLYVLRGHVTPKTRGELERLAASASDFALAPVRPLERVADTLGIEMAPWMLPPDRHALWHDVAPGPVTICATRGTDADAPARCVERQLPPRGGPMVVTLPAQGH
jgi:serine/threonine protein kinase